MKLPIFGLLVLCAIANAQFGFRGFGNTFRGFGNTFRGFGNTFRNVARPVTQFMPRFRMPFFGGQNSGGLRDGRSQFSGNSGNSIGNTANKETEKPVATGNDSLFPEDCGRDDNNKGKLCFPDGLLCQNRLNNGGIERFGNHNYLFSWQSNDARVRSANWDWFNARNYCRKRCMDLVSFETEAEYEWVKQRIASVKYIWTSGRLCNFDGCDRPDFFPKNINGWFWSANQARLNPSNGTAFQDWSFTGGASIRQPDNREKVQQGGEDEACMAVLNNFYGDGIKWHDVACHHEKPIICEDTEGHLQFARQTFPNLNIT